MRRALLLLVLCGCGRSDLSSDAGAIDAGLSACRSEVTPASGRVRFEFPQQPCRFSLAQAAAGISFRYAVIVSDVDPQFVASSPPLNQTCAQVKSGVGIYVFEQITDGGSPVYCTCDQGLCMQAVNSLGATAGRTELSFPWDGRPWFGPSDTNNPKGPPLAPGDYVFSIQSTVGDSRSDPTPVSTVRGEFFFSLTP